MSDRDRESTSEGLGYWGYSLAILLACLLVSVIAFSQGRQSERRFMSPHNHAESGKDYAQRACGGLERAATYQCIYDAVASSNENARAEQDLDAQQWMAFWALVMAILSAATIVVTAVGVWFVKRTLEATLVAVEDTSKATVAMVRQNELTEASQRPRVIVTLKLQNTVNLRIYSISVEVINIGASIAYIDSIDCLWRDDAEVFVREKHMRMELGTSLKSGESTVIWRTTRNLDTRDSGRFFGGTIYYRSAFSREHKTYFIEEFVVVKINDSSHLITMGEPRASWPDDT